MNVLHSFSRSLADTPSAASRPLSAINPQIAPSAMQQSRGRATAGMAYGPHARRAPGAGPMDGTASQPSAPRTPAPEEVTQVRVVALVRAWMRALAPDAWAAVHDAPHPLVVTARRWAPIAVPAVVGSLLLTLTLALVARGHSPYALAPAPALTPILIAVYLLGGALLGLALHFAPNGIVWSLALLGGPPLLLIVMLTVAYGAPGGLLALATLAALLLIYSAWRRSITRAGSVEVTLLLGEWYRTLHPGYNILLPGERIITTLRTRPRAFTTATQRVPIGPNRIAQARATVAYLVNAREAWRTAGVRATWEDELRQRISASVRDSLSDWRDAPSGNLAARSGIARRALDDTRGWARSVGVRILSVRAHDIAIGAPDELQPQQPADAGGHRPTPRMERAPATPRVMSAASFADPADPPAGALDSDEQAESAWATDPPDPPARQRSPAPRMVAAPARIAMRHASLSERPSPAALEDLYEAIRGRQITDTHVIREIADHFAALAREPLAPDATLPFDPMAAAHLLADYADALESAQSVRRSRVRRR